MEIQRGRLSAMKKIRIGVIGIGDISNVYLNNLKKYNDMIEITACASRGLEKAQRKARRARHPESLCLRHGADLRPGH